MIPVILIQQHKYVKWFERLGAISYSKSIIPEEHGMRKSLAFRKLLRQQIIVETSDGRYYLDQLLANQQRKRRRTILIIQLVVIISALILIIIVADYYSGDKVLNLHR